MGLQDEAIALLDSEEFPSASAYERGAGPGFGIFLNAYTRSSHESPAGKPASASFPKGEYVFQHYVEEFITRGPRLIPHRSPVRELALTPRASYITFNNENCNLTPDGTVVPWCETLLT